MYISPEIWPSLLVQLVKNPPIIQDTWVRSLGREDPLEEEMANHSSILSGESHGQRSLVVYNPCGHKESDMSGQRTLSLFQYWHISSLPCLIEENIKALRC